MSFAKLTWEEAFGVVEPQINAEGMHVWPFDPFFPIDVRFFSHGETNNFRMNRHDYCELAYIHSGKIGFQIQDRYYQLRDGDLIVVSSNLYHRLLSYPESQGKMVLLFFEPELIRAATANGDGVEYLSPFFLHHPDFPHVVSKKSGVPDQVHDLIQKIQEALPAHSDRARLSVKTYLKMILVSLVNHYAEYSAPRAPFNQQQQAIKRLRPLFAYLDDHYGEPIRVQDAARICAMSTSHFMYFFKRVTGQSFLSYLNHFRIEKAQALLSSTDKSVSEVSQEMGFCDQSHFGMVFRKTVGITPLAYKRRFGKAVE